MKNKTVYHDMGYLMAESLGLVSEEVKQMDPVSPFNEPDELKKRATAARAAGRRPAKSPVRKPDGSLRMPKNIKYPKGSRP